MDEPDVGLFGPDSVTWRVHADPATLVGGMRALLVQALNPVAMAAVAQYDNFRDDPWGRFRRTSDYLTTTTFGDRASAHAAAARVRALHRRVHGVDPVTGRNYRADDPDLLLWVHAVEVESFLVAYRRYAWPLSDDDADRYVAEMVRAAELVGLARDDVPATVADLADYLASVPLALTPAARDGMRLVFAPPMPLPARPLWALLGAAAVAILPPRARSLYGLPWAPLATPVVRAGVGTLLRIVNAALPPPPPVRAAFARARSAA